MDNLANAFSQNAAQALSDARLKNALGSATTRYVNGRIAMMSETTDAAALRAQGRAARLRAMNKLPELLEKLEARLTERGVTVLWAADAAECNQLVLDIAREHAVRKIVKGKSMATEETGLNHALIDAGLEVIETDLGEFVVQIGDDRPSHIIAPIIHKTRDQVRDLFVERLHMPPSNDPETLTMAARAYLRQQFITADMGITGCNFAIAETGTLAIVTNEGNGRMSSSLPRVHVAIMGIEKVVESLADFGTLLQLLTRSATGQRLSCYVHLMGGPARRNADGTWRDPDGPDAMYVILLDNGRSRIHESQYTEILACIRCGACLNTCPVYQNVGGHAYGWVYSGPIGAVITPLLSGLHNASPLPNASSLCGACKDACPVDLNIPDMLLRLRADLVTEGETQPVIDAGIKAWAFAMTTPRLYELAGRAASAGTQWLSRRTGAVQNLPGILGNWTQNRDFPPFAPKSFHQLWRERQRGS